MNDEQINQFLVEIKEALAIQGQQLFSYEKRLDENDKLTSRIHELTTAIEKLAMQLTNQKITVEKMIETFDERISKQGERIAALEKKPALRWEALAGQILTLVVAAVLAIVFSKIGLG